MRLTTVTNVTVDGVTQGHRRIDAEAGCEADALDDEGRSGFEPFGWAPPLLDDAASTFISQAHTTVLSGDVASAIGELSAGKRLTIG